MDTSLLIFSSSKLDGIPLPVSYSFPSLSVEWRWSEASNSSLEIFSSSTRKEFVLLPPPFSLSPLSIRSSKFSSLLLMSGTGTEGVEAVFVAEETSFMEHWTLGLHKWWRIIPKSFIPFPWDLFASLTFFLSTSSTFLVFSIFYFLHFLFPCCQFLSLEFVLFSFLETTLTLIFHFQMSSLRREEGTESNFKNGNLKGRNPSSFFHSLVCLECGVRNQGLVCVPCSEIEEWVRRREERRRKEKKEGESDAQEKSRWGEGNQIQEEKMFNFHFSCPFDLVFACYLVSQIFLGLTLSLPFFPFPSLPLSLTHTFHLNSRSQLQVWMSVTKSSLE